MKFKPSFFCRLCYNKISIPPILILRGMPKAAQHFLKKNEIKNGDNPINFKILQCRICGLVQLNIKPVSYYKSVITATSISKNTEAKRLFEMRAFCKKYKLKKKKVIEIGCASGAMIDIIKKSGMEAYGLEFSKSSVKEAKKKNRKVFQGYLGDIKNIPNNPYDAFVCYNFLEHIPDPNSFIKRIYANLKDNGVGLVTVPNFDYILKTKSFYEFVADHLSYFTEDTIKNIFERNNFKIIKSKIINDNNDILIIVQKSRERIKIRKNKINILNLNKDYLEVEKLIKDIKNISFEYQSNGKKIAIWGAGHRTLALLALSKFKKIEFIVDSAKFKQGKYSPVNLTKIVSPDVLEKSKIDLLIIMLPGIYYLEVVKKLSKMNLNFKLAILRDNKIKFIKL